MAIVRAGAVVVALVVCAWFALGARQAINTSRATAAVVTGGRLTPGQAARVRSQLSAAGTLNPDRSVELVRGQLAVDQHRYATAERIFKSVAHSEPMNLEAWDQLAFAAGATRDTATVALAVRRIHELYPKPR